MNNLKAKCKFWVAFGCAMISYGFAHLAELFRSTGYLMYIGLWFLQKSYDLAPDELKEQIRTIESLKAVVNDGLLKF